MEILVILIILSVLIAVGFLIAFFIAVRNDQYEDIYTPSIRILFEEKSKKIE